MGAVIVTSVSIAMFFVHKHKEAQKNAILDGILQKGEITVIMRNNAHCYYLYQNQPMGFEYDLAKAFANYLGIKLKVIVADQWEEMLPTLMEKKDAFIAASMTITHRRQKLAAFSNGYMTIEQFAIINRSNLSIKSIKDLNGKTIHLRKGTSYEERLKELQRQGINVMIEIHDDAPTEELIRQVSEKDIEITIADSNVALLNQRYYPHTFPVCSINEKQDIGWAVNINSKCLLDSINAFFKTIKENGKFKEIYDRYYANVETFDYVDIARYHRRLETRLPKYSHIVKKAAEQYGFDWRLITAQMYQESHFNPRARSRSKARGLMQLTYYTAKSLKVKQVYDPTQNINAGVQYLRKLYDLFDNADDSNRLFMALAAYNIGRGHMLDARNLASKMKLDPNKWSDIATVLPLLMDQKYHKDAIYGYCKGTEPIKYIKQIMIYYDILRHRNIKYE